MEIIFLGVGIRKQTTNNKVKEKVYWVVISATKKYEAGKGNSRVIGSGYGLRSNFQYGTQGGLLEKVTFTEDQKLGRAGNWVSWGAPP